MSYISSGLYSGIGGLLGQQQGVQQAYGNMAATYTTAGAKDYQDAIKAVAPDRMEVGVDPCAWLRQRVKEIEWRA